MSNIDFDGVDPFDPQNFKNSSVELEVEVKSEWPDVLHAGKPKKSWWFRVHPNEEYRKSLPMLLNDEFKKRGENPYLFHPSLEIPSDLEDLVRPTLVTAAITSTGIPFLYCLVKSDSAWYESGLEVIQKAIESWVRVSPDGTGYRITSPQHAEKFSEPNFLSHPFRHWLETGFRRRLIATLDHPVVKELRGAL